MSRTLIHKKLNSNSQLTTVTENGDKKEENLKILQVLCMGPKRQMQGTSPNNSAHIFSGAQDTLQTRVQEYSKNTAGINQTELGSLKCYAGLEKIPMRG